VDERLQHTHCKHVACRVDDSLVFANDTMAAMKEAQMDCALKGAGKPEHCLGGDVVELDGARQAGGVDTALGAKLCTKNACSQEM